MKTVKLDINYTEYSSIDEMEPQDIELVKAAIEAQKGSYAPYSTFNVGAALRLEDGTIVKGANQENAAYPSGLCAERTAMFAASANNPDFRVNQRGQNEYSTGYTVDRWYISTDKCKAAPETNGIRLTATATLT